MRTNIEISKISVKHDQCLYFRSMLQKLIKAADFSYNEISK